MPCLTNQNKEKPEQGSGLSQGRTKLYVRHNFV